MSQAYNNNLRAQSQQTPTCTHNALELHLRPRLSRWRSKTFWGKALVNGGNLGHSHISTLDYISNKMILPLYVLYLPAVPWLFGLSHCPIIITIQRYRGQWRWYHLKLRKELLELNRFFYSFTSSYILSFCGWVCNAFLLNAHLTHSTTS